MSTLVTKTRSIPELFGCKVFNDKVMRAKLPRDTYKALKKTMQQGTRLELDIANEVANAMRDWAVENGVTHFTHWFQPMTGITAEKHDSFIEPDGDGQAIMTFSGKALVRGEPDASSFPSGGLRATFEARGYTVWDITSYAFIKDGSLCIPTAFCSYSGEALDKKTPLLRSMEAVNTQALRVLKLFGNPDVNRVTAAVGPEQEYFLIDKEVFLKRPDLILAGRTVLGARPPKGQELDDHYFGSLKPRVSAFMKELDEALWELGIFIKTKHNEVAPGQHEFAPIYTTTNIATDQNQISMELMKSIADKHNLACLLAEKPFAGVNGSGKHNNWSLSTNTGVNLLEPGHTPHENAQFLLFLVAVIKAVNEYQDLLRITATSAGNDHRLGANEAPPAIISIFLGDELTGILDAIDSGTEYEGVEKYQMQIGVTALPHFPKDTTDRNRTSPLAFTGNKFEFRMLGSSFSVAGPNIALNTSMAEALCQLADKLEQSTDFAKDLADLIKQTYHENKRIVFNGNNYCDSWVEEAEKRGLSNLKSTVEALPKLIEKKNVELFKKHQVLNDAEVHSRYEIFLEEYSKVLNIEGLVMIDMIKSGVIPGCVAYQNELAQLLKSKRELGSFDEGLEEALLSEISTLSSQMFKGLTGLENALSEAEEISSPLEQAQAYRNKVYFAMEELRVTVDKLETLVAKKHWYFPSYADILYSVM